MNAMILVDMPDDAKLDEWYAVKVVVDRLKATEEEMLQGIPFDESKTFVFVPLRPLPRKLDYRDLKWCNQDNIEGWNDCLDEITGETE